MVDIILLLLAIACPLMIHGGWATIPAVVVWTMIGLQVLEVINVLLPRSGVLVATLFSLPFGASSEDYVLDLGFTRMHPKDVGRYLFEYDYFALNLYLRNPFNKMERKYTWVVHNTYPKDEHEIAKMVYEREYR